MPLVTGSDAGNMLVFHGPTVHREMQLWVEAGIPPAVALQAATYNAAKLLGAENRIGLIKVGHTANLLVVDGDPTKDIAAAERISLVVIGGERVRRAGPVRIGSKNPLASDFRVATSLSLPSSALYRPIRNLVDSHCSILPAMPGFSGMRV